MAQPSIRPRGTHPRAGDGDGDARPGTCSREHELAFAVQPASKVEHVAAVVGEDLPGGAARLPDTGRTNQADLVSQVETGAVDVVMGAEFAIPHISGRRVRRGYSVGHVALGQGQARAVGTHDHPRNPGAKLPADNRMCRLVLADGPDRGRAISAPPACTAPRRHDRSCGPGFGRAARCSPPRPRPADDGPRGRPLRSRGARLGR